MENKQDNDSPITIDAALAQPHPKAPKNLRRTIQLKRHQFVSLMRLGALTARLKSELGIHISPLAQQKISDRIMRNGKARDYRTRPMIFDPVTGYRETYGDRRKRLIAESQRQGVEIAAKRRQEYVQRRTNRWRKLVETKMPQMFLQALNEQGLPTPVDHVEFGGFDPSVDFAPVTDHRKPRLVFLRGHGQREFIAVINEVAQLSVQRIAQFVRSRLPRFSIVLSH